MAAACWILPLGQWYHGHGRINVCQLQGSLQMTQSENWPQPLTSSYLEIALVGVPYMWLLPVELCHEGQWYHGHSRINVCTFSINEDLYTTRCRMLKIMVKKIKISKKVKLKNYTLYAILILHMEGSGKGSYLYPIPDSSIPLTASIHSTSLPSHTPLTVM